MTEREHNIESNKQNIECKAHYAYVTRSLINLYNEGRLTNVNNVLVEPEYGYVARIEYNDGSYRVTYGNDLGLNPGASEDLAKDKGHTKFMLRSIGVKCPQGDEFLLPWWYETINESQRKRGKSDFKTIDKVDEYIENGIGYPVYVKPVAGSKGGDVNRVESESELLEILATYEEKKVRVAIVEEAVQMPDYRIVVLDGQLISAYQRIPLAVTGNGSDNVETLIDKLQDQFFSEGRDTVLNPNEPRITRHLGKKGLDLSFIPNEGESLTLASISNLSAGGTSLDVTKEISPHWVKLAGKISSNFNLRLCGVDLACTDITSSDSDYSVLEVNSTPGLDHYASSGEQQKKIVDDLYTMVLNAPQSEMRD